MAKPSEKLKIIFEQLGLQIPEAELCEIATAVRYIEDMRIEVRRLNSSTTEPAYIVSFLENKQ